MKKTSNTNSKQKKQAKIEQPWQDYFCTVAFKVKPADPVFIEEFCKEWLDYVRKDPKYIVLWHYPENVRGIGHTTFMRWAEKYEFARITYEHIKRMCSNRREAGASYNEMNASFIIKSMPMYNENWKAMEREEFEFKTALASKLEGKAIGAQIVVIEKYPSSDLVPKKEE